MSTFPPALPYPQTGVPLALSILEGYLAESFVVTADVNASKVKDLMEFLTHVRYVEFSQFTEENHIEALWSKFMQYDYTRDFINSAVQMLYAVHPDMTDVINKLVTAVSIGKNSRFDESAKNYFGTQDWLNQFSSESWLLIMYLFKLCKLPRIESDDSETD